MSDAMWQVTGCDGIKCEIVKHSNLASPRRQTVWQRSRRFWLALAALCDPNTESDFHVASKQIQTDSVLQSASKETFKAQSTCHMSHHIPEILKSREAHALSLNRQLPAVPPSRRKQLNDEHEKTEEKKNAWKRDPKNALLDQQDSHGFAFQTELQTATSSSASSRKTRWMHLEQKRSYRSCSNFWDSSLVFLWTCLNYTLYALCIQIMATSTWHVSMRAKCSEWRYGFQLVQWPHVVLQPFCAKSVLAILAPLREAHEMWHLALNFIFHNSIAQAASFLWQHAGLLVIKRLTPRRSGIAVTWLGNPSGVKMTGWQNDAKMPLHKTPRSVFWGWQNFKKLKEDRWLMSQCTNTLRVPSLHPSPSHIFPSPAVFKTSALPSEIARGQASQGLLQLSDITKKMEEMQEMQEMWANATCATCATWPMKKGWHWQAFSSIFQTPWETQNTTSSEEIEKIESPSFASRLWDPGIDRSMCQAGVITHEPGMRSSTSLEFVYSQMMSNDVKYFWKKSWNLHI